MNIETILGSPRKKGNTNQVLLWMEEALRGQGHGVNRINTVDHKVNGCKGCFTCKKSVDEPGCPQKDDVSDIVVRLISSDIVVYSTPIYFWGPTAQMKALLDRHCCIVTGFATPNWHSLMEGKRVALVVTCEDDVEENVDLTVELFNRFAHYLKCRHAGSLIIPFTTTPDALGDGVKEQAVAFAQRLTR
ncbi:flavodoxin family protein [Thermodesulfobacteriota bacterium]